MKKRILAVASSGGHWTQLLRLIPVFEGHEVSFVSTNAGGRQEVEGYDYYKVTNATRKAKFNFVVMFFEWLLIVLKSRPHVIITTGSAPGMVALAVGKLFGKKTIWIDSIANVEQLSSSGKIARRFADLYLTQWESLARPDGPQYMGSVL
jgi:UDP-N-acetylglucosamine:LPS N-acetylglucosamine transferase